MFWILFSRYSRVYRIFEYNTEYFSNIFIHENTTNYCSSLHCTIAIIYSTTLAPLLAITTTNIQHICFQIFQKILCIIIPIVNQPIYIPL